MDSILYEATQIVPGRTLQLEQLYNFFGHRDEPYPSSIYIHGATSTGKSTVIKYLLEKLEIKHAIVNLNECYSSKILFENILNKLTEFQVDPSSGHPYAKYDNLMDFIFHLKKCSETVDLDGSVIVLEKAEQLRQMEYNLLPSFLRLKELTGLSISAIFLSEIIFEKYYARANVVHPIKIYFPQYIKEELLDILSLDYSNAKAFVFNAYKKELDFNLEIYKNYLNVFLSVFYRACRDVSELRHMAKINFVEYCRPVMNNECKIDDSMLLWRHIAPTLKSSLEVLYLRVSTEKSLSAVNADHVQRQLTFSKEDLAQSLELPFYAKYLLIAAYLASYNPAKDDKRMFMKYHGKKKKTTRDVKAKSKVSEQLNTQLGPKAFGLDRLLAIFYAILEDKVGFNNNLLVQVSSLVELQLLTSLSDNFSLDGQKYKCIVGYDFIQTICKMVGFNIRKYLSDFSFM